MEKIFHFFNNALLIYQLHQLLDSVLWVKHIAFLRDLAKDHGQPKKIPRISILVTSLYVTPKSSTLPTTKQNTLSTTLHNTPVFQYITRTLTIEDEHLYYPQDLHQTAERHEHQQEH